MTGYQAEVQRMQAEMQAAIGDGNVARTLHRRFYYAALSGEMSLLQPLDVLLDEAIAYSAHPADLWLLKAHVAMKRHRLDDAETALRADASLVASAPARLLQSDVDLQRGRYSAAQASIKAVLAEDATWDALARQAHLTGLMGDWSGADDLYAAAESELSAKQMQSFAWLEVQRGSMKFQRGHYEDAERHYDRAESAFPGYWLVEVRKADLMGAQGRFDEAAATYSRLYSASQRPEWAHALGDLYSLKGNASLASRWKVEAHARYVAYAEAGEKYYFHYLTDLCCEMAGHEAEAVDWARKDIALRSNFMTQGDLAWSLYRSGDVPAAVQWMDQALSYGMVSARLYVQAACICAADHKEDLASKYMRLAISVNPHPSRAQLSTQPKKAVQLMQVARSSIISSEHSLT